LEKFSNTGAFTLEGKPVPPVAAAIAFQHLLAMAGGILTAPLLIALGMGLSPSETSYLISSALVISGFATLVQINRVGPIGSGLLSLQGTSFAFVGPLIFSYQTLITDQSSEEALGVIFGSTAFCSLIMFLLSFFLKHLKNVITPNVSGTTVMLLGITLVLTTLQNLAREFDSAGGFEGTGFQIIILSGVVLASTILISRSRKTWLRVGSITFGLIIGFSISLVFGSVDLSGLQNQEVFFIPEIARYPISIDPQIVGILLPIFLVSTMESIGDITATNALSVLPTTWDFYNSSSSGTASQLTGSWVLQWAYNADSVIMIISAVNSSETDVTTGTVISSIPSGIAPNKSLAIPLTSRDGMTTALAIVSPTTGFITVRNVQGPGDHRLEGQLIYSLHA